MKCPICKKDMEEISGTMQGKDYNHVCLKCGYVSYTEKEA